MKEQVRNMKRNIYGCELLKSAYYVKLAKLQPRLTRLPQFPVTKVSTQSLTGSTIKTACDLGNDLEQLSLNRFIV